MQKAMKGVIWMKTCLGFLVLAWQAANVFGAELITDWAYHSAGSDPRFMELVPGGDSTFLQPGSEQIADGDTVTIHVLTCHNFAGDMDEQIFVRWWDGSMSHWIMGSWVRNLTLDAARPESVFRGHPVEGTVMLDLWKVDIPPVITRPGENFYAIQLKGVSADSSEERYLLNRFGGDFCQTNNLGQIWSASEEFDGQDWIVRIME